MSSLDQALRAALDARRPLLAELHQPQTDCYRLFHGSQEGQPGLTVDRYGSQMIAYRDALTRILGLPAESIACVLVSTSRTALVAV